MQQNVLWKIETAQFSDIRILFYFQISGFTYEPESGNLKFKGILNPGNTLLSFFYFV